MPAQTLSLLCFAAVIASLSACRILWRRRAVTPAASCLTVAMLGVASWSAATGLSGVSDEPTVQRLSGWALFAGVSAAVAGYFCYCLAMVDRGWRLSRRLAALLAVEPATVGLAIATNGWHHGFTRSVRHTEGAALVTVQTGPFFWLHTAYCYLLLGCSTLLVLRALVKAPQAYRRQFVWPLLAVVPPVIGNGLGVTVVPWGTVDLTPISFLFTAGLCHWALVREALPELVPVAHQQVLGTIDDAVLVVDRSERLLEVNPAADRLLRRLDPNMPDQVVGLPVGGALGVDIELIAGRDSRQEVRDIRSSGRDFDLRVTALGDRRGEPIGWVLVAREITGVNQQKSALKRNNARLLQQIVLIDRLRHDVAEQAIRDVLTGLYNRRYLTDMLPRELALAARDSVSMSVLLIDIDHFKSINDRYGHLSGDDVLAAVAEALTIGCRDSDIVARYGGEEFVVLLPGAGAAEARNRAERLRLACAELAVPWPGGVIAVTISVGVATFVPGQTGEDLLGAADRALYRAKESGRNRVETAPYEHAACGRCVDGEPRRTGPRER